MWKFLEEAAKTASVNASNYVTTVQEKAQTLATAVQDEASTLLKSAMESTRSGPVDEILYEESTAYEEFSREFSIENHENEINFLVDTDDEVRELLDALVPLELSYQEFWRRYLFRKQQMEQERDQLLNMKKTLEDTKDDVTALDADNDHKREVSPSFVAKERREKGKSEDQEGRWLLMEARDAERRAAKQWQEKAKELHRELQEMKQQNDEKEQLAMKEWEEQLQTLCDTYEMKMAEATLLIDEARAAGYEEGVRESQVIVESMRQKAKEDNERFRREMEEGAVSFSNDKQVAVLTKEKEELERKLQVAQERVVQLEKPGGSSTEDAAIAELTKEKDLWRTRALKMKKLKDLAQTELTTLRHQRDADRVVASDSTAASANLDDLSSLQVRMTELQTQLANAVADSEARAREAYEKGIEKGKSDAESQLKQQHDLAFQEGYKKAQAEATGEMGVLKAELKMFRAFHQSAAQSADHVDELNTSVDDISLADGQTLCSPTSSVSIFTDNGETDLSIPKSSDDWGEW